MAGFFATKNPIISHKMDINQTQPQFSAKNAGCPNLLIGDVKHLFGKSCRSAGLRVTTSGSGAGGRTGRCGVLRDVPSRWPLPTWDP